MLLNEDQSGTLLKGAHAAIDACLNNTALTPQTIAAPQLNQSAGCFVTIHQNGQLRGCIGTFESNRPLHLEVAQMAVAAATADPRFYAMGPEDIGNYSLDISILSPRVKIDDITQIEVGTHGIYLEKDYSRGVLLPQVAGEHGWDRQEFIKQTCIKAGLPTDAWRSPRTAIFIFSAQVISENENNG